MKPEIEYDLFADMKPKIEYDLFADPSSPPIERAPPQWTASLRLAMLHKVHGVPFVTINLKHTPRSEEHLHELSESVV